MGIPVFREPVAVDSKPAAKNDPTAPSRSSIRRQRPARYSRQSSNNRSTHGQSPRIFVSRRPDLSQTTSRREPRSSQHQDGRRGSSSNFPPFPHRMGHRLIGEALRQRFPERFPERRMRIPRESTLRFEMPSPPWSASDNSNSSSGGNGPPTLQSPHLSFTPRFAPAYPFSDQDLATRSPESMLGTERPSVSGDSLDSSMPLLRRVGHRSVTEANRGHQSVDGLGDRQRSLSPQDDNNENDTWETLLSTITPDEHLPSADSSFTSATASASNALSRNYGLSSSNRSLTPSFNSNTGTARLVLDPYPADLFTCDFPSLSEDSNTEAELDDRLETSTRDRRRHSQRNDVSTAEHIEQAQPRQVQASQLHNSQSSFSFRRDGADPDLHQMQAILDRLARREDIPDEWWAAAGLSRSIGRGLGVDVDLSSTGIGQAPANGL